jgi:hypothetical protein
MADENPAQRWIDSVEDPNSVVNQYDTTYSNEGGVAMATGKINQPVKRNVDQWGNDIPDTAQSATTLSGVYKTLSNWQSYLTGKPTEKNSPYVNPQWGKENIRTVRDVMGLAPAKSVGMK